MPKVTKMGVGDYVFVDTSPNGARLTMKDEKDDQLVADEKNYNLLPKSTGLMKLYERVNTR